MMENRSNRAVERKLKEALKNDRARIQVGRISHFGLLEMSRQRIRQGVVESSTHKCPTCNGTGLIRSVESLALMVMRNVEEHVMKKPGQSINLKVPVDVALYILNSKRNTLSGLEAKYDLSITVVADDHVGPSHFAIERGEQRVLDRSEAAGAHVRVDTAAPVETAEDAADALIEDEEDEEEAGSVETARADDGGERSGRRRRRRRRGGAEREDRQASTQPQPQLEASSDEDVGEEAEGDVVDAGEPRADDGEQRRRRRRGRRGGRRNRRPEDGAIEATAETEASAGEVETAEPEAAEAGSSLSPEAAETVAAAVLAQDAVAADAGIVPDVTAEAPVEKPKRGRRRKAEPVAEQAAEAAPADAGSEATAPVETEGEPPARPKRTRAPRKKAAPPAEADVVAAAEDVAAISTVPAVEAQEIAEPAAPPPEPEAESPSRRRRKEIPEGEILVSSSAQAPVETLEETVDESKPKKVGWWQRRLGLG